MQHSKCNCCGKPLSDPLSVDVGLGPICRMKGKASLEQQADLFGGASYSVELINGVICIIDLDQGGKSVTNDIDNVLVRIQRDDKLDIFIHPIIYRDSMGVWDGVNVDRVHHTTNFFAIGTKNQTEALRLLKAKGGV